MKRVVSLILLLSGFIGRSAEPQTAATGVVQGIVTRVGTKDPIAGVQVSLYGKGYGQPVLNIPPEVEALLNLNRGVILKELNRAAQNGTVVAGPIAFSTSGRTAPAFTTMVW